MRFFNIVFTLRAIGAMEILFALSSVIHNYNFSQDTSVTKGVVIDFTEDSFSDSIKLFAPVIKYTANDEKFYEINSNYYTNWGVVQIGDSLNIAYKNTNPEDAKYLEGRSFYSSSFSNFIFGFVFIGLSFVADRFKKKIYQNISQLKEQAEVAFLSFEASITRVGEYFNGDKKLYFIEAEYTLGDETKTYVSEYFEQDPTQFLNERKTVTIKGKLFSSNYIMDTTFLPFD